MKKALKKRNDPKHSLWRVKSSTLGTTDRRSKEKTSATFRVQVKRANCCMKPTLFSTFCMCVWYIWQISKRAAEWSAMQTFHTYFCGAKLPMEAETKLFSYPNFVFLQAIYLKWMGPHSKHCSVSGWPGHNGGRSCRWCRRGKQSMEGWRKMQYLLQIFKALFAI